MASCTQSKKQRFINETFKRGELSLVALLLSSSALVIYKRLVDVVTWCNGQKDNEDTRDGNEGIDKRNFLNRKWKLFLIYIYLQDASFSHPLFFFL